MEGTQIGMEWEPQLVLLAYPKKAVDIYVEGSRYGIKTFTYTVTLTLPCEAGWSSDGHNLEFRSRVVPVAEWARECARVDRQMVAAVKTIARHIGPTGLMLPALPNTKHLNLSPVGNGPWALPRFGLPFNRILLKTDDCQVHRPRLHLPIPYTWPMSLYLELADGGPLERKRFRATLRRLMEVARKLPRKPLLLGYSMTGKRYIRRMALF